MNPEPAERAAAKVFTIETSIAHFVGSIVNDGFDPGAYAPGFMLSCASRTNSVMHFRTNSVVTFVH